jgi:predicted RNA-binding Zn ribbon-like protein
LHFAPDTVLNLEFAVALCNTVAGATKSGRDELTTVADLDALLSDWVFSGRIDHDELEVADMRVTRDRARRLWTTDRDEAVTEVNAMLFEARALPQLQRHDQYDWHIHAIDDSAPLGERMRVEVAMTFLDVIRSDEMHRLRMCGAPDCDGVLIDLSRNGSKQYCSIRCGNRMNMIAYRDRAAAVGDGPAD